MSHENYHQVITALNDFVTECNHCVAVCLDEQDLKILSRCFKVDIGFTNICNLTATLLARDSEHGCYLIEKSARVCNANAKEYEKHAAMGMQHCRKCEEVCKLCAEACSSQFNEKKLQGFSCSFRFSFINLK